ncbi:MAG: hypothetical protein Kow0025_24740 [Thermodesulfovibrionales bacterium]
MAARRTLAVPILGLLMAALLTTALTFYFLIVSSLHDALHQREAARAAGIKLAVDSIVAEEAEELSAIAGLLGGNPGLARALASLAESGDSSGLRDLAARLEPGGGVFIAVADAEGRLVHGTGPAAQAGPGGCWGIYEALRGDRILSTTGGAGGWFMRASAPVAEGGEVLGVAVAGRMVDDAFAQRLAADTDSQISFCTMEKVLATSFDGGRAGSVDLAEARRALKDSAGPVFVADEENMMLRMYAPVRMVDETFALVAELDTSGSHAVLAASKRKLIRYFLLIFAGVMVLGSALTLHIVRPLRELRRRATEVIRDFSGRDEGAALAGDEVGSAVRAFDLMVGAVDRHMAERREAEEARKLYLEAVEAAPDGIQIFDLNGVVMYSNRAVEQICGYAPGELQGRRLNYIDMDPEFVERVVLPAVRRDGRWSGELSARHRQGRAVAVWLSASLIRDEAGSPMAVVGVMRDVTEKRLTELERERLIVQLQQALAKIKTLKGLIPICAWCGKARNDKGYWDKLENYIREHSDASFTHGICPSCMKQVEAEDEGLRKDGEGPAGG